MSEIRNAPPDCVATPGGGRIAMVPCPGVRDWVGGTPEDLETDLSWLRAWGATALITLLEPGELVLLEVEALPERTEAAGMVHLHLPITDMRPPGRAFEQRWAGCGAGLRADLAAGRSVAVHCWAGLGRSGTVAARLLVEMGVAREEAILLVREARRGAIQTPEQERHVRRCRPART